RDNGSPFLQTYPIDYQNGAVSVSIDIPLAGLEMDLDNGNGPNTIPINYTLTLNENTGGATPTPTNQVQINHSFENTVIGFADGFFGNFTLEVDPADVDLDFVQSDHSGYIYFEDPRLRLRISNTIGADVNVSLDDFYAIGGPNPQVDVDLSSLINANQVEIPAAPTVGDSSVLEYYFTQNNSNIKDIVNGQYEEIYYDASGEVNPNNGPAYNFAALNNAVEVVADVELPFWGFSDHFTVIDTIEVPFNVAEDFADNVDRAMLRINTLSHFPADGRLKMYFADTAYNLIDSVLYNGEFVIQSGITEQIASNPVTHRVIAPVHTNNDIELDSARIYNLFDSNYLLFATDITSTNDANHDIKVFLEDNIEIRAGLRVKLKASPSDINDF
ncbi:MAG: hypothetical protein QF371_08635, partial [Flavobacteriales bacterium]|nr:hypothetical protein [Flavobacteriales bacterium]